MKKSFIKILFLILLLSTNLLALAGENTFIINTNSSTKLHLRQKPSKSSKSLGLYYKGTRVEAIGNAGSWTKVKIGEETGYMLKDYLSPESNKVEDKRPLGYVCIENVYLRQKPSANSEQIEKLNYQAELEIIGETSSSWYYVAINGKLGYVKSSFISLYFGDSKNTNSRLFTGKAVIDGKSSNKVHLRQEPDAKSSSLGLFFSGTEVECFTEHNKPWIGVKIGQSFGFIQREYLSFNPSKKLKKLAFYSKPYINGKVNIRENADVFYRVLRVLKPREQVRVLGETNTGWYLVSIDNIIGYVKSENMRKIP